ncbi:hypothetical protein L0222_23170 [bacterium]|nr:hypothetical protein [bacterium]
MNPEEALGIVIDKLDEQGIPYMIVGSFASNLHGVPRTTHDADLVIEIDEPRLQAFARSLGSTIHTPSGFKVDFVVRKERLFSRREFERRILANFLNRQCWFATPEDTILSKLEWSKKGESEKQFRDAVSIAKVQPNLKWEYLQQSSKELDVEELLERLIIEIKKN